VASISVAVIVLRSNRITATFSAAAAITIISAQIAQSSPGFNGLSSGQKKVRKPRENVHQKAKSAASFVAVILFYAPISGAR
jgi:hypothetical protein